MNLEWLQSTIITLLEDMHARQSWDRYENRSTCIQSQSFNLCLFLITIIVICILQVVEYLDIVDPGKDFDEIDHTHNIHPYVFNSYIYIS